MGGLGDTTGYRICRGANQYEVLIKPSQCDSPGGYRGKQTLRIREGISSRTSLGRVHVARHPDAHRSFLICRSGGQRFPYLCEPEECQGTVSTPTPTFPVIDKFRFIGPWISVAYEIVSRWV